MITIKKISSLKPRVQLRKVADVFHEAKSENLDSEYLEECLSLLPSTGLVSPDDMEKLYYFFNKSTDSSFCDIYYYILNILGESPADWDFKDDSGAIDWSKREIKDHYLYLDHLRSPYNIGAIFRSAESFGIKKIYISPGSASPEHPRAVKTSRMTTEGVAWKEEELENIDLPIFALELGGKDISEFEFPEKGVCIIGSEETGVSPEALRIADASLGRVSIKQYGAKGSINVSAATAILLHRWMEKAKK